MSPGRATIFYNGSRVTDDGVKAAATSSMMTLTGIEGKYNLSTNTYDPPAAYRTWGDLLKQERVQLRLAGNLKVLPEQEIKVN